MKEVAYCVGVLGDKGVLQGLPEERGRSLLKIVEKINKDNAGYQLTPSDIVFPGCQILILQSDIPDSDSQFRSEVTTKYKKIVFDENRFDSEMLTKEIVRAMTEEKTVAIASPAASLQTEIKTASQSGQFSFEGAGVLFQVLLPFIVLGLLSFGGAYALKRKFKTKFF